MTEAMVSSKVCVLAGGTSLWEANYMEKLVVGLVVAENQLGPLQAAKEAGIVEAMIDGRLSDSIEVADGVGRIVKNLARSRNARVVRRVDGRGADRLALAILDVMAHRPQK
jgi:Spore coat polysaccharide biosynthesis protein, predicted glycosyltransferase